MSIPKVGFEWDYGIILWITIHLSLRAYVVDRRKKIQCFQFKLLRHTLLSSERFFITVLIDVSIVIRHDHG